MLIRALTAIASFTLVIGGASPAGAAPNAVIQSASSYLNIFNATLSWDNAEFIEPEPGTCKYYDFVVANFSGIPLRQLRMEITDGRKQLLFDGYWDDVSSGSIGKWSPEICDTDLTWGLGPYVVRFSIWDYWNNADTTNTDISFIKSVNSDSQIYPWYSPAESISQLSVGGLVATWDESTFISPISSMCTAIWNLYGNGTGVYLDSVETILLDKFGNTVSTVTDIGVSNDQFGLHRLKICATDFQNHSGPYNLRIRILYQGTYYWNTKTVSFAPQLQFSNSSTPLISGSAKVGNRLNATIGSWDTSASVSLQWLRDGQPVPGATSNSYSVTSFDVGSSISVRASGFKLGVGKVVRTSASTSSVSLADFDSSPVPSIAGQARVGNILQVVPGAWDSGTNLSIRWQRGGVAIPNATSMFYEIQDADLGSRLSVIVEGTKSGYIPMTRSSSSTSPVIARNQISPAPNPTISGTASLNGRLYVAVGTWESGTQLTIQWYADGNQIDYQTGQTLLIGDSLLGKSISVSVTGTKPGFNTVSMYSDAITVLGPAIRLVSPKISGSFKVGASLKAGNVKVAVGWKLTYQWLRDGNPISGATKSTFKLSKKDRGHRISLRIRASRSGYRSAVATSKAAKVQ